MSEWKEYRLNEIGTVVGGATPSTMHPEYYDGSIPWITPKDLTNWKDVYISKGERSITEAGYKSASCKIMPRGSVLFSSRAPIGYIAIAANDICTNQGFKSVVPNPDLVESVFLYYSLLYNRERIKALGSGTTFAEISGKVMSNVCIRIPSLQEQRSIASILSSLDSKIENNRKICANLEAQAQALFKHWFIDFAPFKDGKFVESELGMIPEGWRVGKLGDLTEFLNGFAFKSSSFVSKGKYKVITIKAVQDGKLITDSADEIEDLSLNIPSHCVLKIGDILLSLTGNVGRVCIVTQDNLVLNQRVCILNPRNLIDRGYVYTLSRTKLLKTRMINIAKGTAQANLSPVETSKLSIVVPPRYILDKFGIIANEYMSEIISAYQENQRLSSLRDTLLPKLMSGEIKV